ncbi:hypothetical protein LNO89_03575 [Klebsiella pneumoniae subsp. pneumoniae]|nr:hypothetical protein [Klebsiella pneumoniae subsp. pneumoniae]
MRRRQLSWRNLVCRAGRWSPVWSRPLPDLPLSLVYPQNRYPPPAVRAFYDWSRRVLQPPHSEALMPGHRPGYWPRMACFNFVTSQFSAGSCARRLCRKMHSVNSGYATGGASAQRILRLPALRQPLRDGGEQRQVVSGRERWRNSAWQSARAARAPGCGELAVDFTVAGFAIGHHPHVPRRQSRSPTADRGRGSAAATTGW